MALYTSYAQLLKAER